MRIVFDIDGVVADFVSGMNALAGQLTGKQPLYPAPCRNWLTEAGGLTEAEDEAVWKAVGESADFWANLPHLPHTHQFVAHMNRWASQGHDIVFVTNRSLGKDVRRQTDLWLKEAGVLPPRTALIVNGPKGELLKALGADVFVDDYPGNIVDACAVSPNTKSLLLAHPYNQGEMQGALRLAPELVLLAIEAMTQGGGDELPELPVLQQIQDPTAVIRAE